MKGKYDKYCLLTISVVAIVILSIYVNSGSEDDIGYVDDVQKSKNGFLFHFVKEDGTIIKCYSSEEPIEGIYRANVDDYDGSICFIKNMRSIEMKDFENFMYSV